MNPSLTTIVDNMIGSSQSECTLVGEFVSDLMNYREEGETDEELAERINASMDEIIAAAKIVQAWAQKGVTAS